MPRASIEASFDEGLTQLAVAVMNGDEVTDVRVVELPEYARREIKEAVADGTPIGAIAHRIAEVVSDARG